MDRRSFISNVSFCLCIIFINLTSPLKVTANNQQYTGREEGNNQESDSGPEGKELSQEDIDKKIEQLIDDLNDIYKTDHLSEKEKELLVKELKESIESTIKSKGYDVRPRIISIQQM